MTAPASAADAVRRREVVSAARDWIGTPYRRRASVRGAGADCLGLIRGLWRDLCGPEPVALPLYSDDWLELNQSDVLHDALCSVMRIADHRFPEPGSVLAFRFGRNRTCKHVGIVTTGGAHPKFVHAYCRYGVVETSLDPTWRKRIAAIFELPPRST